MIILKKSLGLNPKTNSDMLNSKKDKGRIYQFCIQLSTKCSCMQY